VPTTEAFELERDSGALRGLITLSERPGPRPTIVICHGFKGFMEWGFFPYLAELFAQRGFTAIRFNFSGAGMAPGDQRVTDLDAFGGATFGGDVDDARAIVAAAGQQIAPGRVDRRRLGLLGHSRGGGAALLSAAEEADLAALVTWSAVATFDRVPPEHKEAWHRDGELPIENARTRQVVPVRVEVLEDLEANPERYDLGAAAARRRTPWLIVHGDLDQTVPVGEAEALRAAATAPVELVRVEDGDHTFGAKHPFVGPTPPLVEAMNATQRWFLEHLREERSP
jgi:dienelactone hydrolase